MEGHPNPTPTPSTVAEGEARRNRRKKSPAKNQNTSSVSQTGTANGQPDLGTTPQSGGRRQFGRSPRGPRPAKPETFQVGPLDPLPKQGQSTQDLTRATQRQNAERKQFKVPASQQLAQRAIASAAGRDIGSPLRVVEGQPSDGQRAVALLRRNPSHLAGIFGATTDRRPGYLRAQNMPNQAIQQDYAREEENTSALVPGRNQDDSWRRSPNGKQNPRTHPQFPASYGHSRFNAPARPQVANIAGTRFQNPATNVREIIEMLDRVPNPWPSTTQPFPSAYRYTLTHPDPRSQIPAHLLDPTRHSPLSTSILESWRASEPSRTNKETVARILNQVNAVFRERYGKRFNLVIEPFGSVSWGGETGDTADVDMTLKVSSKRVHSPADSKVDVLRHYHRTLLDLLDVGVVEKTFYLRSEFPTRCRHQRFVAEKRKRPSRYWTHIQCLRCIQTPSGGRLHRR